MRSQGYVTMLDPFQLKYGSRMGGLLFLPALMGELCWSAAILSALGATISVILDLNMEISVTISACIAAFYTFFGGLYSVAYTDVIQLICIFFGLWLCIPFALTHEAVLPITNTSSEWIGTWDNKYAGVWFDYALLLMFGGIPWQVYFQRVLSSKTAERAQWLSYVAAGGCIIMAVPPILIGAIGYSADWSQTKIDLNKTRPDENPALILPLVIQYLTPPWVSFVGLGAVSAAVMSSADSSILSASSMFVRNIYKLVFRQGATERELLWVLRLSIVVVTALALVMGLTIKSVYALWFLCSDFVYVILFPQLFCVVYFSKVNTYGSFFAYIVALFLRLGGGDTTLRIPPFIKYPLYNDVDGQLFPFRTFAMSMSFLTLVIVSYLTNFIFLNGYLRKQFDVFQCIVNIPELHREKYDTVDGENLQLKTIQTDGPVDGMQPGANDLLQRDKLLDLGRSIIPGSISKEPLKDDMDDSPESPDSPE
ncbi:high-affinity choline transporter 1 [Strongylocentrotus purpuratus]|uniref:High-affinity choline transporter 1 n=1 Tax=Strongylocentrotus purpuratus TaxID=7668 RepID=A0A7M7REP5_STRPU|nr:high-affinity choline transporter 1 [Strongylocentrotus purpuratus]|eukprot:XP_795278.3 PREDICTED: high-affinity choline transporter 1 [Strongylocentrotus purpuratus]